MVINDESDWKEEFDLDVELAPCPFCGGVNLEKNTTNPSSYWIECVDCGGQTDGGGSWQEAVDNWNRRSDKRVLAERERVRKALDSFFADSAWLNHSVSKQTLQTVLGLYEQGRGGL